MMFKINYIIHLIFERLEAVVQIFSVRGEAARQILDGTLFGCTLSLLRE